MWVLYLLLALLVVKAGYEVFFLNNPNRRKSSESDKGNPDEQEILRKIRRWEFRKRRKASDELRKQQEWWRGIDGRGFELGVAKVLLKKGYSVKHTGSSWGGHCGIGGGKVGASNLPVQYGLSERFVLGVKQGAGFRFVLGAEAELFAGGGVLVIKNTRAPEKDKTLFHDNAFRGHEW